MTNYYDVENGVKQLEGYTVWVCEIGSSGNITGTHHVSHHVGTVEEAKAAAIDDTCMDWFDEISDETKNGLHILGVAKGNVSLVEWEELT